MNGLKSGKDRTEPWVLFACALERTADTDSHRELSRLPHPLSRSALLRVRDGYSSRFASLIFANLMTFVTASSDLTSLRTLRTEIRRAPFIRGAIRRSSLKEVIQPHLPVRLPCYDFTPLTGHSFGASVPYGFGQRLREQQIQVM